MRCNNCPALRIEGYEYPEEVCVIGVPDDKLHESKSGEIGCKLARRTIMNRIDKFNKLLRNQYKFIAEYFKAEEYRMKGIDIDSSKNDFVYLSKICIGMYNDTIKYRYGRRYFDAYKNFFIADNNSKKSWLVLTDIGYAKQINGSKFILTDAGIDWLGRTTNTTIKVKFK